MDSKIKNFIAINSIKEKLQGNKTHIENIYDTATRFKDTITEIALRFNEKSKVNINDEKTIVSFSLLNIDVFFKFGICYSNESLMPAIFCTGCNTHKGDSEIHIMEIYLNGYGCILNFLDEHNSKMYIGDAPTCGLIFYNCLDKILSEN